MNRRLIIVLVLGGLTLAGIGGYFGYSEYHRTNADINDLEAEAVVTADEIFNAFENNTEEAGKKYLGKVVEVSGRVLSSDDVVLLAAEAAMDGGVQASLKSGEDASLAYAGADVRMKCQCTGRDDLFGSVVMKDCVIIK